MACFLILLLRRLKSMTDMTSNTPFLHLKKTGDDKHDVEVYVEDLIYYCVMQNWFDPSKDTDSAKWTKLEKTMACLRASLSPAGRAVYGYLNRIRINRIWLSTL